MNKIEIRDLARTVRDTAVAGGVAEDKSIRLREGSPDPSSTGRSISQILAALDARGMSLTLKVRTDGEGPPRMERPEDIDGEGEEITPSDS